MSKLDEIEADLHRLARRSDPPIFQDHGDILIRAVRQLEAVRKDTVHLRKWIKGDLSALSKTQIIEAISRMTTESLFSLDPDVLELTRDG